MLLAGLCNGAQIKTDNNLEEHIDQGNLLAQRGFQCILCVKLPLNGYECWEEQVRYDFICVRKGFFERIFIIYIFFRFYENMHTAG